MLLEKRDNPNIINSLDGATALTKAIESGNADVVQLLLNRAADPTMPNTESETPLEIAIQLQWYNIAGEFKGNKKAISAH